MLSFFTSPHSISNKFSLSMSAAMLCDLGSWWLTCSCFGLITTIHILTRKHAYPINTVHCECSDTGHSIMYIPLLDILSFLIDNIEIKRTDNTPITSDFSSERKSCIFYVGLKINNCFQEGWHDLKYRLVIKLRLVRL